MNKKLTFIIPYTSFGVLGFYRGLNEYKYNYKNDFDRYNKNCKKYGTNDNFDKPQFFYIHSIFTGTFGLFMYLNPILTPTFIYKELYRLEVNIRGLDEEKKGKKYNEIF